MPIHIEIKSDRSGTLAEILALPGAFQRLYSTLAIVRLKENEVRVKAPSEGHVLKYLVEEGSAVKEGQSIAIFVAPG